MNPSEIRLATQLYNAAIAAGATHNNAISLVGSAYQESSFNPRLTGSDGGTSFGLMQVGSGLWQQMQRAGVAGDPVAQMEYYINALQSRAPGTWEAMQNAASPQAAFSALYSNPDWRMGTAGLSNRFDYYNQLAGILNQNQQPNPAPAPSATPQPADIGHEFWVDPTDFGALTAAAPASEFNATPFEPPLGTSQSLSGALAQASGGERPGFVDLTGVVPSTQFPNPVTNENLQAAPVDQAFAPQNVSTNETMPPTAIEGIGPVAMQDYTQLSPSVLYGQGYDEAGVGVPWVYGAPEEQVAAQAAAPGEQSSPGEVTDNAFADEAWLPAEAPSDEYGQRVDDPFADEAWTAVTNESSGGEVTDNPFADPTWIAPDVAPAQAAMMRQIADLNNQSAGVPGSNDTWNQLQNSLALGPAARLPAYRVDPNTGQAMQFDPSVGGYVYTGHSATGQYSIAGAPTVNWAGGIAGTGNAGGAMNDTSVNTPTRGMIDMLGLMGAPASINRPGGGGSSVAEGTFAENKLDKQAAQAGFDNSSDYLMATNQAPVVIGWDWVSRASQYDGSGGAGNSSWMPHAHFWAPRYSYDPTAQPVAMPTSPPAGTGLVIFGAPETAGAVGGG